MGPQPSPPRFRGCLSIVFALFITLVLRAPVVEAQTGPRILHDGLRCVLSGQHLILEALVEPTLGLTTVKAYFRANLYNQFYYVEMIPVGDVYQGVLPKPSGEITGLHYYLEAMDSSFNSVRTAEYTPEVVSNETDCRERNPTPAAYLDGTGAITVGSTGGGPAIPSGFLSEGIAGTIPAIGRSTGGGSGLLVGGAAAAGAAVGVGVLVSGDDPSVTSTSTTMTTAATTSVPVMTTIPTANVTACFETSPSPPTISVGDSVRFDASCTVPSRDQIQSYVWNFNDGSGEREGRVVNRRYTRAGTFGAVLTVTALDGAQDVFELDVIVQEEPPPGGGGGGGGGGGPTVSISKGGPATAAAGVEFPYTISITNSGSSPATGITMMDTIPAGMVLGPVTFSATVDSCGGGATVICNIASLAPGATGSITIRVTPSGPGGVTNTATLSVSTPSESGSDSHSTAVSFKAPPGSPGRIVTRLTSHLELPPSDGGTLGRVTFNESRTAVTDNSGPSSHDVPGRSGENTVEGFVTKNPSAEGTWRFDFRGARGFVPGSITIETGQVVSREPTAVVFRVAPGARRLRFRYRLE